MGGWRDIICKRQISGLLDGFDARCGAYCGQVNGSYRAPGDGRQPKGQMQRAVRRGQIVDIAGLPGHMQSGGIMRQRLGHGHARTSNTSVGSPVLCAKYRSSRFCAVIRR